MSKWQVLVLVSSTVMVLDTVLEQPTTNHKMKIH